MNKLRVGIIGCGNIFPMHAYPVAHSEYAELIAICDIKSDRLASCAAEFGCKAYTDYEEMFAKESLDVVHICTPHHLHSPMTISAAHHGINVLTEKPMATELSAAKAMVMACQENRVTLGVIFQNRYNPGAIAIKNALTDGSLKNIRSCKMEVTWDRSDEYYSQSDWKGTWDKEGGGVIIDQAIHTLDLMRWFVGSDIEFIDANIANRLHQKIDVEDSAEGVIHFKNGVNAAFFAINYYTTDSPVRIEIHCENGYVKYEDGHALIAISPNKEIRVVPDPNEQFNYGNVKSYWGVSHIKQINNFYQALLNGTAPDITGNEALLTQQMINGIYDSGKKRQRIFL